jgi:NAD(P)H-flavin reductase
MGDAFRPGHFMAVTAPESMAAWVMSYAPATDAEALKLLRGRFPDSPLSLRVAALDFVMRRRPRAASAALGSQ